MPSVLYFALAASILWCASGRQFLLVAVAPPVNNFYFTKGVDSLLTSLREKYQGDTFELAAPPCPHDDCAQYTSKNAQQGVAEIARAMWNQSQLEREVGPRIQAGMTVIGLHVRFSAKLAADHPQARFVSVHVGHDSTGWVTAGEVVRAPFLRGAYLSGTIAAIVAASRNDKITVLAPSNSHKAEIGAFRQGVTDGNQQSCVNVVFVDTSAFGENTTASFIAVQSIARQAFNSDTTVIYSILGEWDQAVLVESTARSNAGFRVFTVTGPFNGAAVETTTTGQTWLNQDLLDWGRIIESIVNSEGTGEDYSDSLWTAPWAGTSQLLNPSPALDETTNACGSDFASRDQAMKSVAAFNIEPNATVGAGDGKKCLDPAPELLPAVTNLLKSCTAAEGSIRLVGVGIYITVLGNVDMKAGSFYADFNLYLHQSKRRYRNNDEVTAALQKPTTNGVCYGAVEACLCPPMSENEWENYIQANETDIFDRIMNIASGDRLKAITPVFKPDVVGPNGQKVIDYFRYQGNHYFNPDLSDWPLDTQHLFIALEGLSASVTDYRQLRFCHMDHYSGLSPRARYFPGMSLQANADSPWQAELSTTCWPYLYYPRNFFTGKCSADNVAPQGGVLHPYNDVTCSCLGGTKASARYTFQITFQRPQLPAVLKTFLPPIFITLVNQGVWFLHPKGYATRLGVCGSSLVSSVMFHVSLVGNTPETSVVTWADRLMGVVYYNNLMVFGMVFGMCILYQAKFEKASWKLFIFTRMWGPVTCIVSFMGIVIFDTSYNVFLWAIGTSLVGAVVVYLFWTFVADRIMRKIKSQFEKKTDEEQEAARLKNEAKMEEGTKDKGGEPGVNGNTPAPDSAEIKTFAKERYEPFHDTAVHTDDELLSSEDEKEREPFKRSQSGRGEEEDEEENEFIEEPEADGQEKKDRQENEPKP